MTVTPHDGLLRFLVGSDKGDENYLVDLVSFGGTGQCNCPHFRIRLEPLLNAGAQPVDPDKFRCKHIRAARDYIANEVIETMIRQQLRLEKNEGKSRLSGGKVRFK